MAITASSGITFDGFHFAGAEYDELLQQHGSPADLRVATRCACWREESGAPDPACTLCYPFGYLYAAPERIRVHGPNRKPMKRLDEQGSVDLGDAFFTLPVGKQPPWYSRLSLPRSLITIDDTLTRGREEVLRFSIVVAVLGAHTAQITPGSNDPSVAYDVVHVPLTAGVDYVVDPATRQVTWPSGSAVPDGGRVVFQCRVASEWILWDTQDRNEHGQAMPYRYLGKRLDYLLHPRGKTAAADRSF